MNYDPPPLEMFIVVRILFKCIEYYPVQWGHNQMQLVYSLILNILRHGDVLRWFMELRIWNVKVSCIRANKKWYKSLTMGATMLFNKFTINYGKTIISIYFRSLWGITTGIRTQALLYLSNYWKYLSNL